MHDKLLMGVELGGLVTNSVRRNLKLSATSLLLICAAISQAQTPQEKPESPQPKTAVTELSAPQSNRWPREFKENGNILVLYMPQIDSWDNQTKLVGRAALRLTPLNSAKSYYGALRFEAQTRTNPNNRTVYVSDIKVEDVRFSEKDSLPELPTIVKQLVPSVGVTIELDEVLAYVDTSKPNGREIHVSTEAPKIFYSTQPALLIITQGDPVLVDVKGTSLKSLLNTNWDIFLDSQTSSYYLLDKDHWLTSKSLEGPWTSAPKLPADLSKLPADENWARVKKQIPPTGKGPAKLPEIFYNPKPAELIVMDGDPKFVAIEGTRLKYVANTEADVFFHEGDRYFYYLTAGRWFRSAAPADGVWELASDKLSPDFAQIPENHPKARVLANVKGTREAEEAVLMASIPQTVTMKRVAPDVTVEYAEGKPEFVAVPSTSVSYAKNTQYDVFLVGENYYLCYQAAWFVSANPTGPWEPAASVPQEIYQIPPESPKYNVTYVTIEQSSPTTVVYSYTPGYTGMYIAYGCVVLGTGYYYPPYYWGPYYYPYPYYGYGMGAAYNPYTGTYARGGAVYGPYGGYGQWSAYNPHTGTSARGAGWYGPYDAGRWSSTYNPRTGTYSHGYAYTNYEQAWGERYIQKGDQWAKTGWYADERGAVGGIRTSEGTGAIAAGNGENRGIVAKGQDNIYVGKDDNVYKRDQNGNWYQNSGNGWSSVPQEDVQTRKDQAQQKVNEQTGSQSASANAQAAEQSRASGQPRTTDSPRPQPGAAQSNQAEQFSQGQGSRTGSVPNKDTLSGLTRDASARQAGAQRSQQYKSWGNSAASSGRSSARASGGRRRR
jgi:hypothetical protein